MGLPGAGFEFRMELAADEERMFRAEFHDFGAEVDVVDPLASPAEVEREYGIRMIDCPAGKKYDAVVVAVAHRPYLDLDESYFLSITNERPVLADIKGIYRGRISRMVYWSL